MTKALTIITGAAAITKAIESIKGRGAKLDADIHVAAVSSLMHFAAHGDITLANRLLLAMPKSTRRNALAAWFLRFAIGSLMLNTDKASRNESPLVYVKEVGLPAISNEVDATPFWELKATEGAPVWAFDTFIASQTKSLTNALAKTTDEAQRAKLQAAIAALA